MTTKLLFVCLGNICRSPTAEGAMRELLERNGLSDRFELDSAGTGDWHLGEAPDVRAQAACRRAGFDISMLRSRLVREEDFYHFDLILACDKNNLSDLKRLAPADATARIELLMSYAQMPGVEVVPDPYYGSDSDFDRTVAFCQSACNGLLDSL